ncbi:phage tail protein [Methylophaga sp.]|uniref:phage tail-collar fiber domain-containing protein n=1 Tax=Methylophaga sp. TaxID=2024840 RepID=UPI003A8D572A
MADLRCYLTTAGIAAENNAKQFGTTLKITDMVFDGEYLADEQNPESLTEVINPVLTVPCSTSISEDGQTLTFKGSILVEQGGFNVWGIGLKTDSGVLYGYARSKGDKILTEDEGATESVRYAVDIITKNAEVIEIKINQSTVYADLEDVDNAIKAHEAYSQMLPYDQTRTYKQNETCTTFNATTGELEVWTSYAPSDNKGNNPQDPTNRHEQWANFPTPCWWIKHHAVEPGTPVYWFSDDIPGNALQVMDIDIDAGFYHRIAKAYPSLVADGKINLADLLGRYIRVADGVDYLVNTTHEDAIRNITGLFADLVLQAGVDKIRGEGAFRDSALSGNTLYRINSGGGVSINDNDGISFDASRVVPTASQNQPKSTMANLIIFI